MQGKDRFPCPLLFASANVYPSLLEFTSQRYASDCDIHEHAGKNDTKKRLNGRCGKANEKKMKSSDQASPFSHLKS